MKKPITIISSISILLFLIAIIYLGAGIYLDKQNGAQKADARYETLLSATKNTFTEAPYGTFEFSNGFIRAIGNIEDFSSLKLEVNGTLVYSYPPEIFSLPSPDLVKSYTDTVSIDGNSFTLRASLYLMTPNSIYSHSRFAFLLILVGTVIAGVFIIVSNRTVQGARKPFASFTGFATSAKDDDDRTLIDTSIPKSEVNAKSKKEAPAKKDKPEQKAQTPLTEPILTATTSAQKPENTKEKGEKHEDFERTISFDDTSSIKTERTISFDDDAPAKNERPIFNPEAIFSESKDETEEKKPEAENSIPQKADEPLLSEPMFPEFSDSDAKSDNEDETDDDVLDIIDQLEQENQQHSEEKFSALSKTPENAEAPAQTKAEMPTQAKAPVPPKATAEEEKQTELRSPITQLYLEAALEQKLDEAISANDAAVLVLVRVNGLDRGNFISQRVISILKAADSSAQIFEFKADAYALVINDSDLQETVEHFEGIFNQIDDFLKNNNAANEVSIGISSVSGRMVSAERIILEASQALAYASQDPDSPIVAFRANPEKYREFQESESSER